jgi:hypothetical protein
MGFAKFAGLLAALFFLQFELVLSSGLLATVAPPAADYCGCRVTELVIVFGENATSVPAGTQQTINGISGHNSMSIASTQGLNSSSAVTSTPVLQPSKPIYTTSSLVSTNSSYLWNSTATSTTLASSTALSNVTVTSSTATTSSTPSCSPSATLVGADEMSFNPKNSPIRIDFSCFVMDVQNFTILANWDVVNNATASSTSIAMPGFADDYVTLAYFAIDSSGHPFFGSFQLLFGSASMPVLVLGVNGNPQGGVQVQATAPIYPGVEVNGVTDATGMFIVQNLPSTTIALLARDSENEIAITGLATQSATVTLRLLAFSNPANAAGFEGNGTTGWTGGMVENLAKRDLVLDVDTNGEYDIQLASSTFIVDKGAKAVFIKYRFVTTEVPGGYFGSQFNDYFSITIRSDSGAALAYTNSMNALGLGAFDEEGSTPYFTLTMSLPPNTSYVDYIVGVSNVVDNLFQSQVIIDQVGEECGTCGDCTNCPQTPMCQPSCQNPPPMSCSFYSDCAEASARCGAGGYPLQYGLRNCNKFSNNLSRFSAAGQNWIWATMHCLQQNLVPTLQSCSDCGTINDVAFASHPACYVGNGFCTLTCSDYVATLATVGFQDLSQSLNQVGSTAIKCIGQALSVLTTPGSCVGQPGQKVVHVTEQILNGVVTFFEDRINYIENNLL